MIERIVDMSNQKDAALFLNELRRLNGLHRFEIKKFRGRRSDRQNRYYWPCFVKAFGDFLRDQGEAVTDDHAHNMLKHKFLTRSVVNHSTGELMDFTESTAKLNTAEFNEYLDRCACWLADMFHIVIPDPEVYHETE